MFRGCGWSSLPRTQAEALATDQRSASKGEAEDDGRRRPGVPPAVQGRGINHLELDRDRPGLLRPQPALELDAEQRVLGRAQLGV